MAKATNNTKRKTLPKSGKRADARLIENCIAYAQCISSINAAFAADPDPNCETSNRTCDTMSKQARKLLAEIATTPATTHQGLQAKARIAVMAAKDNSGFDSQNEVFEFFSLFAKEVKEQLQPLINDDWKSSKSEKAAA